MIRLLAIMLALPALASADSERIQSILSEHILPGFENNMVEAERLRIKSEKGCPEDPSELREGFHLSFDAWIEVSHLRFGPTETDNRAFALAFWPDPRNATGKTVAKLLAASDPVVSSPESFREISVAGQGFYAMERLLFDDIPIAENEYACELLKAIARRIAEVAAEIYAEWESEYSALYLSAGNEGNHVYPSQDDALRDAYTSLLTGLQFVSEARLGRPLGSFDRPRPRRADARRSARSLRHVEISLASLSQLAGLLSRGEPKEIEAKVNAAFSGALEIAGSLNDPIFAGVGEPAGRLRVEILQQRVDMIRETVASEIGPALGIAAGFNALDGD